MSFPYHNETISRKTKATSDTDWLALLEEESARLRALGHHVAISSTHPPFLISSARPLSIAFADMLRDGARLL